LALSRLNARTAVLALAPPSPSDESDAKAYRAGCSESDGSDTSELSLNELSLIASEVILVILYALSNWI
jgi:hypothetical protein